MWSIHSLPFPSSRSQSQSHSSETSLSIPMGIPREPRTHGNSQYNLISTLQSRHDMHIELTREMGRRIATITDDTRKNNILLQCVSVALQRGNEVCFQDIPELLLEMCSLQGAVQVHVYLYLLLSSSNEEAPLQPFTFSLVSILIFMYTGFEHVRTSTIV